MSETDFENESDLIYCQICCEIYSEDRLPLTIPGCNHKICERCVSGLNRTNQTNCPFDRKPFRVQDTVPDRSYWQLIKFTVKKFLNDRVFMKKNLNSMYLNLKPSLQSIIDIRKVAISYYKKILENLDSNKTYNIYSGISKILTTTLICIPPTAIFGFIGMGINLLSDTGQTIYMNSSKNDTYCKIEEIFLAHDKLVSKAAFVKFCKEVYDFGVLDSASNRLYGTVSSKAPSSNSLWNNLNLAVEAAKVGGCGYSVASILEGELKFDKAALAAKELTKLTKGLVIGGCLIQLYLSYKEIEQGKIEKKQIKARIKELEKGIISLERVMHYCQNELST